MPAVLDEVLPPLHPDIGLDALLWENSTAGCSKLPVAKNGRLWGYSTRMPSALKGRKLATFRSLLLCAGKLAGVVPKNLVASFNLKNNDKSKWSLDQRAVDALPDAYFLDSRQANIVDWTTIAVPGVYSKENTRKLAREVRGYSNNQ